MTPRLEWTWDGGNFFASASIRYYCWARCACRTNHSKNNTPTALWNWIRGHEMTLREDGSMSIQSSSSNPQSSTTTTTTTQIILPPQNGPNSPSGTCGVNGTEFCPQKWPTSLYGPVPPRAPKRHRHRPAVTAQHQSHSLWQHLHRTFQLRQLHQQRGHRVQLRSTHPRRCAHPRY